MGNSINQLFMKVIAINLIAVGAFAVFVSLIAIYKKKYADKEQIIKLYVYLAGGAMLMIIGALLYR